MKKTEFTCKAHNFGRSCVIALTILLLASCMTVPALAASTTGVSAQSTAAMNEMFQKINIVYKTIRNNIAFPLLALSFASCGFKILGANIIGSGMGIDKGIQAAKEQIFISISALLLLLVLPEIVGFAIDLFKRNAWTPPGAILIPHKLIGGTVL